MNRIQSILALCTALAFASSAQATFVQSTTGLTHPDQTITFSEVALGTNEPVTTQFQDMGVTFVNAYGNDDANTYNNISGNRIGNFNSLFDQMGTFEMDFSSPLSAVAFAMITQPGMATFKAYLGETLVDSELNLSTNPTDANDFFGFRDVEFDRVTIDVASRDNALVMDNLQTVAVQAGAVPEPETWALMMVGTLVVGTIARRRRLGSRH